eukprot:423851-Pelagomonas_calceolata.AAC.1
MDPMMVHGFVREQTLAARPHASLWLANFLVLCKLLHLDFLKGSLGVNFTLEVNYHKLGCFERMWAPTTA